MPTSESPAHIDAELVVEYSKTGGIAGFHTNMTLSEFDGTLSAQDASELGQLLDDADFFNLPGPTALPKPIPDAISYVITVRRGRREHTVRIADGAGSDIRERLDAVFAWLDDRARSSIDTSRNDAELAVDFAKSGGIGGFHSKLTLSEFDGTLSSEDSVDLGRLLTDAQFFSLPGVIESGEPIADGFSYIIGASRGRRHHTVRAEDGSGLDAVPGLLALIAWLDDRTASPLPKLD